MSRRILVLAVSVCVTAAAIASGAGASQAAPQSGLRASLRSELKSYLSDRRVPEHISGVSLAVSFRGKRPGIDMAVGRNRYSGGRPVSTDELWQIGSNTKAFTSVLLLQLEAKHRLSIHDTVGKWLPEYAAWRQVTIKRLLNMTSGIPSYTDLPGFWRDYAADPDRTFSASQLVSYARGIPLQTGYYYSNTAYILAQKIIHRATHDGYRHQLRKRIIRPLGLHDTFYSASAYRRAITARMPAGYWWVPENTYMTSQLGKNQTRHTVSWVQGAGGIVSSLQDVAKWDRALYTGHELPRKQQHELKSLVSQATGKPIARTTRADPAGFGLGIEQMTDDTWGTVWTYTGETNGFRVEHVYLPDSGTLVVVGLNSATAPDVGQEGTLVRSILRILHHAHLS